MKTYFKPSISILACESLGAKMQGTASLFIACAGQPTNCDYNLGADCSYLGNDFWALDMYFLSNNESWMDTGICAINVNGEVINTDGLCTIVKVEDSCTYPIDRQGDVIEGAVYHVNCSGSVSELPCSSLGNSINWDCEGTEIPCA